MLTAAMPDLKTPVALTHATSEKMSRHDMLRWVNATVQGEYKKIEELCSGVAYCQMMEMLFPHSVGLKKVKIHPKLEHEYLHNLKLFQLAFTRINYEKSVPIERLLKGRFQDNFEFLQWFKKFYDVHAAGKENVKANIPQKQVQSAATKVLVMKDQIPDVSSLTTLTPPTANSTKINEDANGTPKSVPPQSVQILQETYTKLSEQTAILLNERDFYYSRLLEVEKVLKQFTDRNEFCEKALAIIYATNAGAKINGKKAKGCM